MSKSKSRQDLIDFMKEEKLNRKWNETIEFTDEIVTAHDLYMSSPCDWDMNGKLSRVDV